MPSQKIEQDRAQTIDISRRRKLCRFSQCRICLLRRNVTGRAENRQAVRKIAYAIEPCGQTKIAHQRFAVSIEQNIRRFEIAMQDASDMCVLYRARHPGHQRRGTARLAPESRSGFDQAAASGKLHTEKRELVFALAHFINGQDIWMVEVSGRLRFAPEAGQRLLRIRVIRKDAL